MRTGPGAKPVDGRNTTGPQTDELSREQKGHLLSSFCLGVGGRVPRNLVISRSEDGTNKGLPTMV